MSTCYIQKNCNNIDYHSNELIPGTDFPSSLCVGQSDIPCSSAARSRAIMCDSQYRLKEQVNKLSNCLPAAQAEDSIFSEATKILVSSLVLSRLDYCNALLDGSSQVLLDKINE